VLFYQLLISHFLFDYGRAPKMIEAKSKGTPLFPIFQHALLHTIGVFIVLAINGVFFPKILILSLFQLLTHFIIDVSKGKLESRYPNLKNSNSPLHWHLFQLDQFLHITVMFIISIL